jgi:predicted RNA polymerase sigma factor
MKAIPRPGGEDWIRPALCDDALRLGRVLAELASRESEVHGLVALWRSRRRVLGRAWARRASRSSCSIKTAPGGIIS